jgi:hypothetical protein
VNFYSINSKFIYIFFLHQNEQVDGIFLDFSKAFDKVPHQRLLEKLSYYGVRGNLHNWIKDFLANRKQEVVLEGKHSSRSEVTSGASASQLIVRYNKQLATNSLTFDEVFFVISLMKIRKRSGPNTVPWGTPDVTSDLEEC